MWNFNKILGICGLHIIKSQVEKDRITIYLKQRRITANCPRCQHKTKCFHGYLRPRKIKNGTVLGKICELVIKPRRFRCFGCNLVFNETLPFLKPYQKATVNHKKEVVFNLSDRSFSSGTKKFKVSYQTQRRWLNEIISNEVLNFTIEEQQNTPFVLGIDEVSFSGHEMVTTIGNITQKRLKGVLHSRQKNELKKNLKQLSPKVKSLISEVVIDMCRLYLKTVQKVLPDTAVVVDHFHIIADANKRIDEYRLIL